MLLIYHSGDFQKWGNLNLESTKIWSFNSYTIRYFKTVEEYKKYYF